ncbi:GNAT family N-acetyltransferase [Kribbella qitaiheensis]|uniref:GNAT family N-acetyltransferase n=1 Tax=Kribbella qitaiheensis TaxID=1544730 RepID=A0A7G6WTF4_9ACTN|nr:GNAT family N-acetyltransferase [Kribbella qitaiheensis]QNE17269.1 GNAT family N-acetyltransferase [Kribbella qitaiheensis]
MDTEIRPASIDDLDGVVASTAALFAEDAGQRDPLRNRDWPSEYGEQWCRKLRSDPTALVLAAVGPGGVRGHLVGMLYDPSDMWTVVRAELVSMYVRPELRGHGVGGGLVDTFVEWARARGAASLQVTAYATNAAALALYQSRGFAPKSITLTAEVGATASA